VTHDVVSDQSVELDLLQPARGSTQHLVVAAFSGLHQRGSRGAEVFDTEA
jgi:hypothetical protein